MIQTYGKMWRFTGALLGLVWITIGVGSTHALAAGETSAQKVRIITNSPSVITTTPGATLQVLPYFPSSALVTGVQWSATGGTISSTGVYTAPATPGTYVVQATVGGVSSSATVIVAAPESPPTPGSPPTLYAAAASGCAAMPLRSTGTVRYFCDCQVGAEAGCVAGNDANAGTSASAPKKTWAAAVSSFNSLAAGGTVALCRGGAWSASSGTLSNASCRAGTDLYASANNSTCDLRDYQPPWGGTNKPRLKYTTGNGLYVTGTNAGLRVLNLDFEGPGTNGVLLYRSNNTDILFCNNTFNAFTQGIYVSREAADTLERIVIRGNRITNSPTMGILHYGGAGGVIDANYFDNNGQKNMFDHTIYLTAHWSGGASNFSITNNVIRFTTAGQCVGNVIGVHGTTTNLNIENNIVDAGPVTPGGGCYGIAVNNGGYAEAESWTGTTVRRNWITAASGIVFDTNSVNTTIENNVIVSSVPYHVGIISNSMSGGVVRNNTIWNGASNNSDGGISISGTGIVLANNSLFFNGGQGYCFRTGTSGYTFVGNNACYRGIWNTTLEAAHNTANPLYASAPTDFTPQAGSPLLGAGSAAWAPAVDANLKARPSPPSIGALER